MLRPTLSQHIWFSFENTLKTGFGPLSVHFSVHFRSTFGPHFGPRLCPTRYVFRSTFRSTFGPLSVHVSVHFRSTFGPLSVSVSVLWRYSHNKQHKKNSTGGLTNGKSGGLIAALKNKTFFLLFLFLFVFGPRPFREQRNTAVSCGVSTKR